MLDTEEKHGGDCHTKSYPKRKLLPEFDDEVIKPIPPKNNTADRPDGPPRGRDKAANNDAHKSAHDLREDLHKKAGMARSIYRSRKCAPAQNHGRPNDYTDRITARYQNQTLQPSEECHDTSKYRGAAHPLCFTDEVLDHEFPKGFKPVNIEAYDGTTDSGVWIRTLSSTSTWLVEMISTPSNNYPSS